MISLDRSTFEKLVVQAINELPERFRNNLNNVSIVVEDEPTREKLRRTHSRRGSILLGLYEGVPQTKRAHYTMVMPDKITLFQKPIEEFCSTHDEIKEQIRKTVLHEIGHHFGMSEKELRNV